MSTRRRSFHVWAVRTSLGVALASLSGCKQPTQTESGRPNRRTAGPMTIKIGSEAFQPNQPIPRKHTGEGADLSPPLRWSNVPPGTKQLALIMDDPDAPRDEPWVHWVLYNLPTQVDRLPEGVETKEVLSSPAGAVQGKNSSGKIGYHGPMPPPGHGVHHYHFKLYALDAQLGLKPGLTKNELLKAISDHVLAEGDLVGTYKR
jgi:Raf kinase inhibitor-like YbhB/YbcL family protein